MDITVTLRRITVTVLMIVGLLIGGRIKVDAQILPCIDPGTATAGFSFSGVVCGCDGNVYASATDAFSAGVTHFTTDSCGVVPICHADFTYINIGPNYYFIDSSTTSASQSYHWLFSDGGIYNNSTPNIFHEYQLPGYYFVRLIIIDSISSTASVTIRVVHVNQQVNPNYFFTFLQTSNPSCSNNGSATATLYGGTPPFTYLWSDGQTNETAVGLGSGNYSVTITDDSGLVVNGNCNLISCCNNVIEGTVFHDVNGNCILDGGEFPIQDVYLTISNGSYSYFGDPDTNGHYSINIPMAGTFTINANTWSWGSCGNLIVCNGGSVTFSTVGDTSSGNNIGLVDGTGFDLDDHPGWTSSNPGLNKEYWLMPFNASQTPFTGSATVTFHYDPNLIYLYSFNPQPVHDTVAHTLTWNATNLPSPYGDWINYRFENFFHVPASLSVNYLLQSDFDIIPTSGDCDSSNNHQHYSETVTGSHDPNEKTVTPDGAINPLTDSVLTYTIHFQNTGTDTTHFVIVRDTLPAALDPATVVNLAASAPYSDFSISGTGILTWIFNPLFLPDSATNEAASKGFVMLKIKVKPNLPAGTVINNTASIYFDYNTPVVTNTATNSIISGIAQLTVNGDQLTVYPNPASDAVTVSSNSIINELTVTDVLGIVVLHAHTNQKSEIIHLKSFASGVYFLKVVSENGNVVVKKLVKE